MIFVLMFKCLNSFLGDESMLLDHKLLNVPFFCLLFIWSNFRRQLENELMPETHAGQETGSAEAEVEKGRQPSAPHLWATGQTAVALTRKAGQREAAFWRSRRPHRPPLR